MILGKLLRQTHRHLTYVVSKYGEETIGILLAHYGSEKPAEILHENRINREAFIISDITTEWKTYHQLLVSKPKNDTIKELASNDMLKTLYPNLSKIGAICFVIPVTTASVERSFSLIKTRLRSDRSLSNLMKIALESPAELTDSRNFNA